MPPTLGAWRCGRGRPQLLVDALLVDDELVDELSEEVLADEPEELAPAGVEELVVLEEPESLRESLR